MRMTKKQIRFFLISIISALTVIILLSVNKQHKQFENHIGTFKADGGWGYNILIKNKIIIHQEIIPAIEGNQKFESENDANKVAELVLLKLKSGKMPTISRSEIDSLKIGYHQL
jgi:hypothetical protein